MWGRISGNLHRSKSVEGEQGGRYVSFEIENFRAVVAFVAFFIWCFKAPGHTDDKKMLLIMGLAVILAIPVVLGGRNGLFKPFNLNVFHYNFLLKPAQYAADYLPKGWAPAYRTYGAEKSEKPNVIVILLESVDAKNSALFSGLGNLTTELDGLAKKGLYFTNYFSNTYGSTEALFSILTGHPRATENSRIPIYEPKYYEHSLINWLRKYGVHTAVFTSAEDILNCEKVMGALVLDYRSTTNDGFYKNCQHYVFNSVSDHDMYANLLAHIADGRLKQPFFTLLATVTTHGPYINPDTGHDDFDECLQYTDREAAAFVAQLQSRGYFENGIVVLVGDHHSHFGITQAERERFGAQAQYRVPLVVLGTGLTVQERPEYFDHTSLGALIEYLQTGTYELNQFQQPPLTAGDKPVLIDELNFPKGWLFVPGKGDYQIRFDGNDTVIFSPPEERADYEEYLKYIAWLSQNF